MTYVNRTLEKVLLRASKRFKVIMVTGIRQSGKSSLLKHLSDRTYVSLDNIKALDTACRSDEVFFEKYPAPLLIEEIQRAPNLFLPIKELVDNHDERGLVWLTGSQRFDSMKCIPESLAGRMVNFELLPFSLYELEGKAFEQKPYLPSNSIKERTLKGMTDDALWHRIWQGAWPDVADDTPENRDNFYNGLLQTYLERYVIQTGINKLRDFQRFLAILATRIGQEFQITKVAAEVGVAVATAREWLSIAESSGIIYLLPPFFENIGKTIVKKPKLYFTDTGLAAWLCGIPSSEALQNFYNKGAFFENFVIIEILKSWLHNGKRANFFFYRDSTFQEVDLLIKDGTTYYPIEIKATAHPEGSMVKAFDAIQGGSFTRGPGALICLTNESRFIQKDVIAHSIFDI